MGQRLGKAVTRFRSQYFEATDHFQRNWVPREGAQDKILKLIADVCVSMKSADYLELPPCSFNDVYIDLPLTARHMYGLMEKEMLIILEAGSVEAANHTVVAGKCLQICNGAIHTDDEHNWESVHDAKLVALWTESLKRRRANPYYWHTPTSMTWPGSKPGTKTS